MYKESVYVQCWIASVLGWAPDSPWFSTHIQYTRTKSAFPCSVSPKYHLFLVHELSCIIILLLLCYLTCWPLCWNLTSEYASESSLKNTPKHTLFLPDTTDAPRVNLEWPAQVLWTLRYSQILPESPFPRALDRPGFLSGWKENVSSPLTWNKLYHCTSDLANFIQNIYLTSVSSIFRNDAEQLGWERSKIGQRSFSSRG